ncbi:bifunctional lysylphosphatidylglycerol flippase/synthetase MprF [Rhizobium sp. NRK18]|uniref:bifunctional lysylphosphatidylglycerol flippase/synthetase MprF n=1 Tax=Rhizobium sp. NRK18 TaxID=2964667 RepID=UPI0021C3F945|nr:bifunctional lysylphosphatidylglycerol flippase/synthetase MprF [Rhizobium sp. NRK18]MCQ2004508.1 bifunctional lysylphosphatidylglycerol flippase/synthetase MprF [Rhizobium sp. NRK18]
MKHSGPSTAQDTEEDAPRTSRLQRFFERFRDQILLVSIVAITAATAYAIYTMTEEVRLEDVQTALADTPLHSIGLALIFTALSFAALIGYDLNAIDYVKKDEKPSTLAVAVTSFMAYSVGNTAGFGALSAGAIRLRAYTRLGLTPEEIGRVIAFVTFSFGLGLLSVAALAALITAPRIASLVGLHAWHVRLIAIIVIVLMGAFVYAGRNGRKIRIAGFVVRLPDSKTSSRQFLVSALDMAASASILYVLLPHSSIGWPAFFAVFSVAIGLGVLSHVPAGLGIFETIIVSALSGEVDVDRILGSLILYRLIYNLLPLVIAALAMIFIEARRFSHYPVAKAIRQIESRLAPTLLSTLALVAGAILIFSSVTPIGDTKIEALEAFVPLAVVEGAHFISSILGLVLFLASRGLAHRLDAAWWMAIITAAAALFFSIIRTISPIETTLLIVLIAGLALTPKRFRRPASLIRQAWSPSWIAAMLVVIASTVTLMLFVYRDVDYSNDLWWQFEITDQAPRALRAALGLAIGGTAVALFSLLRPARLKTAPIRGVELQQAISIVKGQNMADGNMVRMGDKQVLFSDSGNAFIMYAVQGRSWVALFDPIGPDTERGELLWRFVERAHAAGGRAVLYQISPAVLPFCADMGLRAYKLGEAAHVSLPGFELKGSKMANLRQAINKGLREGLEFSVIACEEVPAVLADLKSVSDAWLDEHQTREKTFSLGSFQPDYIASQPVAVLRVGGRMVAFATLLVTDSKAEGSVDLMRFSPDAPNGAMDFLFVRIIEYMRDEGYQSFNLGMAPLSGMSRRETAPVWDRVGGVIFEHAERFYNFKGLKAYKSKFAPKWEPRYIAISGGTSPMIAMMDVTVLIGGGLRGVVGK